MLSNDLILKLFHSFLKCRKSFIIFIYIILLFSVYYNFSVLASHEGIFNGKHQTYASIYPRKSLDMSTDNRAGVGHPRLSSKNPLLANSRAGGCTREIWAAYGGCVCPGVTSTVAVRVGEARAQAAMFDRLRKWHGGDIHGRRRWPRLEDIDARWTREIDPSQ